MATGLYNWSQTPGSNATATYTWAEGMAPSAVNDSARGIMADVAKYRDDISGSIITTGSATAYAVTSFSVFDSLAHMNGQMVSFIPHTGNSSGAVTLNVDGLGAKPLRIFTGQEPSIGSIVAGTVQTATYNSSDAVWYLHGYLSNPQSAIQLGMCIPYFGSSSPNTYFAIPLGQAVSRTTYLGLFNLIGTTHGIGDGSTTFNIPDLGGRTFYGKEATATRLTTAGGGIDGGTLGAVGGSQNVTLAANQIPSLTSVNASQAISVTSTVSNVALGGSSQSNAGGSAGAIGSLVTITSTGNNSISVTYTNGSQAVTKTVAPGIIGNWLMRVL